MDDADRAAVEEELERERILAARRAAELAEAERFAPVRDGARVCADCGVPLSAHRLAAVPHALRCVECQRAHEARVALGLAAYSA